MEKSLQEEWPQKIHLHNTNFSFFKTRDFGQGVLYKSENSYLRLGDAEKIGHELACHKDFEQMGFPMAKILHEGTYQESEYYVEESVGGKTFHEVFQAETEEKGEITSETFSEFFEVVKKYVEAQSSYASLPSELDIEKYFRTWFFDDICEESPHLKEYLMNAKEKAKNILESFPTVLSHNDFNAYNILPDGIIDFAYGQKMPLGYDWTSVLMHTEFFPEEDGLEQKRKYNFTDEQKMSMGTLFSTALQEKNLDYKAIFPTLVLGRMAWAAAHMEKYPKMQHWRFEMLERMLQEYLTESDEKSA